MERFKDRYLEDAFTLEALSDHDLKVDRALTELEGPCTGGFSVLGSEANLKAFCINTSLYFNIPVFMGSSFKRSANLALEGDVQVSEAMPVADLAGEAAFKTQGTQHSR